MINQTLSESNEERIVANNEREEHNVLLLARSNKKSSGWKCVHKDRVKAYKMMTKEQNKSEIYSKLRNIGTNTNDGND